MINPEQKTSILSSRLLQLNTEYTNAQADRVRKEAAFKSVSGGTLEAAQVSTQGEALKKLAERIDEQQAKFAEVKAHYGPTHPEYRKASLQLAELQRQMTSSTVEHRPARGSGVPRVGQSRGACCKKPSPRPRRSSTA